MASRDPYQLTKHVHVPERSAGRVQCVVKRNVQKDCHIPLANRPLHTRKTTLERYQANGQRGQPRRESTEQRRPRSRIDRLSLKSRSRRIKPRLIRLLRLLRVAGRALNGDPHYLFSCTRFQTQNNTVYLYSILAIAYGETARKLCTLTHRFNAKIKRRPTRASGGRPPGRERT